MKPGHCICKWCDGDGIYTETPIDFKYDDEDAKERKYQTYNKRLNRARRKGNPDLPVNKRKKKESGIINHRENNDQAERLITIDNAAEIYDDENAQDKPEQTQPVERTAQTQPHVEEQAVNDDYHQVAWPFRLTYSAEEKENPHDYDYMDAPFIQNAISRLPTELDLKLYELENETL
jgi:hypothetical protein